MRFQGFTLRDVSEEIEGNLFWYILSIYYVYSIVILLYFIDLLYLFYYIVFIAFYRFVVSIILYEPFSLKVGQVHFWKNEDIYKIWKNDKYI